MPTTSSAVKSLPIGAGRALDPEQGGTGVNAQDLDGQCALITTGDANGALWAKLLSGLGITLTYASGVSLTIAASGGGLTGAVRTILASYAILSTDSLINANATGGGIIATLPAPATVTGQLFNLKKIDVTANTVTLAPHAAETIDGQASVVLAAQYAGVTVYSDGANWFVI